MGQRTLKRIGRDQDPPYVNPQASRPDQDRPTSHPLEDLFKQRPIRAARGFSGMVNKPTRFIAGEGNRPEHVQVTPGGKRRPRHGGSQNHPNRNLTIQANDAKSVQEWLEGGAEDVFRDLIYRLQLDGVDVTA